MVLGYKLPEPGRPTYWIKSRVKAYCTCSGCGGGISSSLWKTTRYRLKYCLKGPLNQNNHPTIMPMSMYDKLPLCSSSSKTARATPVQSICFQSTVFAPVQSLFFHLKKRKES